MSSDTTVRAPRRREPLTRERIVRTAIALADDIGIETLSMRKLARELDVEAMSLYNHVKNKGDLVDAMVDDVVSEIELPTDPDWEAAVRRCAICTQRSSATRWICMPRSRRRISAFMARLSTASTGYD